MSEMYGLPLENIEETPCDSRIDMARLSFSVDKEKQINAAMIYIRNMAVKGIFIFDNCTYEQKEEYLIKYMTKQDLRMDSVYLSETWMSILSNRYIHFRSENVIFTEDEINKFCSDNSELVFELQRLIVSIPLISIEYYAKHANVNVAEHNEFNLSIYERSDNKEINMAAFSKLLDFDEFIILQQTLTDITPIWYNIYFNEYTNRFYGNFLSKLPYLDLLNFFQADNESIQKTFIDELEKYLEEHQNNSDNE